MDGTGNPTRKLIARNLKQELKDRNMHEYELAKQTGIAETTIGRILQGQYLTFGAFEKICLALNIDQWVLLLDEEEKRK